MEEHRGFFCKEIVYFTYCFATFNKIIRGVGEWMIKTTKQKEKCVGAGGRCREGQTKAKQMGSDTNAINLNDRHVAASS